MELRRFLVAPASLKFLRLEHSGVQRVACGAGWGGRGGGREAGEEARHLGGSGYDSE